MAYSIIYSYNYVDNFYVIAWIISGILILSLQLTEGDDCKSTCFIQGLGENKS